MPELDLKKLRQKAKGQLAPFLLDELERRGERILDLMHVLKLPEAKRTHMYGILRGSKVLRATEALDLASHFGVPLSRILTLYHETEEDSKDVGVSLDDIYFRLSPAKRRIVDALLKELLRGETTLEEERSAEYLL